MHTESTPGGNPTDQSDTRDAIKLHSASVHIYPYHTRHLVIQSRPASHVILRRVHNRMRPYTIGLHPTRRYSLYASRYVATPRLGISAGVGAIFDGRA